MLSCGLLFILGFLTFSACDAFPHADSDSCGCFGFCAKKYAEQAQSGMDTRGACRSGCKYYSQITKIPDKRQTEEAQREDLTEECINSCVLGYSYEKPLGDACLEGCGNGCAPKVYPPQSRIRLTILLEDDSNADGTELEQFLTDPGLKQQLDTSANRVHVGKTKIPASYFTNLPVSRETSHTCGPEPHLCDAWLAGEPLICAGLLCLAAALLLAAYWRRGAPRELPEQAPMLPEKLQLDV